MNRMTPALALALYLAFIPIASGATIIQTQGFGGYPGLRKTVEFDRFNPDRGELISVQWRMLLDVHGGTHTLDNDDPTPRSVEVYLGASGSLDSKDVALVDSELTPVLQGDTAVTAVTTSVLNLAGDTGAGSLFDSTAPDTRTHFGSFASAAREAVIHTDFFSDYTGTQMFELDVHIEPVVKLSESNGIRSETGPVMALSNVVLIYEYEPVPEPTAAIIGVVETIMAVGFGLKHCRRRR